MKYPLRNPTKWGLFAKTLSLTLTMILCFGAAMAWLYPKVRDWAFEQKSLKNREIVDTA